MTNYWKDRQTKSLQELSNKSAKEINKQLAKYYRTSLHTTTESFMRVYEKVMLGTAQGIQPTPADLYKLNSYWQMQGEIQQELRKLGEAQEVVYAKAFEKAFYDVYKNISLPSQSAFSTPDKQTVLQLINEIWCADGKSWSSRIWTNTERLQQTLNNELINCVVTGKSTAQLKKKLVQRFNVSYSAADSIARTELAHIQTQAAKKRYEDYGIKQVEVWADKDERRCEVCGKLHQKKYFVHEAPPIPAHPRCRCCIVPVVE